MKLNLFNLGFLLIASHLFAPVRLELDSLAGPLGAYVMESMYGMELCEGQPLNFKDSQRVRGVLPGDWSKFLLICKSKTNESLGLTAVKCENPVYLIPDVMSDKLSLMCPNQNHVQLKLSNFKIPEEKKADFKRQGFIATEAENLLDETPNGTVNAIFTDNMLNKLNILNAEIGVTSANIVSIIRLMRAMPPKPEFPKALDQKMQELTNMAIVNRCKENHIHFEIAFNTVFPGATNIDTSTIFFPKKDVCGLRITHLINPHSPGFNNGGDIAPGKQTLEIFGTDRLIEVDLQRDSADQLIQALRRVCPDMSDEALQIMMGDYNPKDYLRILTPDADIKVGHLLVKPGSIPTCENCVCKAYFIDPILERAEVLFDECFNTEAKISAIEGDGLFHLAFPKPTPVAPGLKFIIKTEGKTVGAGVIESC